MSKNFLDSNVYFRLSKVNVSTKQLTALKNMTIILVEIVRMTLDAFWSEKSTICQHNCSRRGFAPEPNVAAIGQPKTAYLNVEKHKFSTDLIHFYVIW